MATNPAITAAPSTGPCGQHWVAINGAGWLQLSEPFPTCLFSASCTVDALTGEIKPFTLGAHPPASSQDLFVPDGPGFLLAGL